MLMRFVRALLVALLVAAPSTGFAQQPTPQEGFVPVDQLPPAAEQLPAAPLLAAAYAVAWLAVLLYVLSLWKRLGRVEKEMADVSRRIEAGSRR